MASASFVSSFNAGNGNVVYAKVDWVQNESDLFHIQIYDKQDWWTGRFSNAFAEQFREHAEQDEEEYRKNVKSCLMNKNTPIDFVTVSGDSDTAKFSWKNIYPGSNGPVTLIHGTVPVHKSSALGNTNTVIDFLLEENKNLRKLIEDYESNIMALNGELDQSKMELEKFLNVKSSLESSVYEKFIYLLNSKKRRIRLLEQNLNELGTCDISKHSEVD